MIQRVFLISISLNYQKTPLGLGVTDTNLLNITVITTSGNILIPTMLYPHGTVYPIV